MEEQIYRQPRRSGKKWILIIAAVFVLLLSAVAFVLTANRLSLSVELDGEPEMMLEYGGHFQDPGAHLCVRGSLLWKDGMSPEDVSVGIQGKVDDEKTGKYILTYAADYRGMHAEAQRIVRVVDTVCPEIILAPDTGGTLLPGTPYQEAGYRAIDNYDGDITDRVVRSEEYGKIIYAVTDSSGNPGYAEREVPYYDPIPPEITLEGDADMAITTGTFYQEPGYSALDNVDGDLTQQVQVDGEVDWLTPGTYSVTYTVTDGYKNTTTVEGKKLPVPHCIKGTPGWMLDSGVAAALEQKGYTPVEKLTFGSVLLPRLLYQAAAGETFTMELVGLCTDICVVSNALMLKANFPEMEISVDSACCAGVTPATHEAALATMRCCQINVK